LKRSEIKRKAPLRASPGEAKTAIATARCKAKGCRAKFVKLSMNHRACCIECARVVVAQDKAEAERKGAKAAADDRRKTKAQLEALKTVPQLKKEAQREFNRFIRARDRLAGHACISSGKPLQWGTKGITGSAVDAGHYRGTGAADHLRFNEDNCHAQSVVENRDRAGNAVAYRIGLIARIGLARVEALENDNTPVKWTREGLREIRDTYRRRANELEKEIAK
jgi:hypothetical protein